MLHYNAWSGATTIMSPTEKPQSWASWLFEQYTTTAALSTESLHDDDYDSTYESMSPVSTSDEYTTNDSASPYGPYVRTGRGGAGNYTWQSAQTPDVEKGAPISLKEKRKAARQMEHIDTSAAIRSAQARQGPGFIRTGRGGAGNMPFVQSNEPQSPRIASFGSSGLQRSVSPAAHVHSPTTTSAPRIGRGGAGNFAAQSAAVEQARLDKEEKDRKVAEETRQNVEETVGGLLQPPGQALLSQGQIRRSRLPDDVESPTWTDDVVGLQTGMRVAAKRQATM